MVKAPTIVFHCIRDNLIPFSQGRLLACSIPNARFVSLDSENHALLSSEPAWKIMMEEMKAFLADGGELLRQSCFLEDCRATAGRCRSANDAAAGCGACAAVRSYEPPMSVIDAVDGSSARRRQKAL
jgi:hypothetical protein